MSISQNKVVTIHYTVTDAASNEVIYSSEGGQPMVYLHGHQNIIPGLENALEGKTAGDELKVEITAADAYGEYSEERVQQVPIEAFEGVFNATGGYKPPLRKCIRASRQQGRKPTETIHHESLLRFVSIPILILVTIPRSTTLYAV